MRAIVFCAGLCAFIAGSVDAFVSVSVGGLISAVPLRPAEMRAMLSTRDEFLHAGDLESYDSSNGLDSSEMSASTLFTEDNASCRPKKKWSPPEGYNPARRRSTTSPTDSDTMPVDAHTAYVSHVAAKMESVGSRKVLNGGEVLHTNSMPPIKSIVTELNGDTIQKETSMKTAAGRKWTPPVGYVPKRALPSASDSNHIAAADQRGAKDGSSYHVVDAEHGGTMQPGPNAPLSLRQRLILLKMILSKMNQAESRTTLEVHSRTA